MSRQFVTLIESTSLSGTFRLYSVGLILVSIWATLLTISFDLEVAFKSTPVLVVLLVVVQYIATLRSSGYQSRLSQFASLQLAHERHFLLGLVGESAHSEVYTPSIDDIYNIFILYLKRSFRGHLRIAFACVVSLSISILLDIVALRTKWFTIGEVGLGLIATYQIFRAFQVREIIDEIERKVRSTK